MAGSRMPASTTMMLITTSISTSVNAPRRRRPAEDALIIAEVGDVIPGSINAIRPRTDQNVAVQLLGRVGQRRVAQGGVDVEGVRVAPRAGGAGGGGDREGVEPVLGERNADSLLAVFLAFPD